MDARTFSMAPGRFGRRGLLMALLATGLLVATGLTSPQGMRAAEVAFPTTIVDDEGTSTSLEAEPQRIVSLTPANTEIVFALGAGDRLVGGGASDDYPLEAADLPDVSTFEGVDFEQVVALEPDLVLAGGNFGTPPDDIARLRELGFPVVVLWAPDVPGVLADIELVGSAIGASEEATALTAAMAAQLEEVSTAASAMGTTPRTFYEVSYDAEIWAPAADSFVADMVDLAGGEAITTGDPIVWSIPLEALIVADPEVIVLGDANYGVCPDAVAARPGWQAMSAVVSGAIRPVDDIVVTRPGPRLAEGLAVLARAIHPDIELSSPAPERVLCAAA